MEKKEYSIVRRGERGAGIAVPAKWIKKHGIKWGDKVYIYEEGDRLIVEKVK